jgi:Reverse transcriptase (RNA-dependent DNA polymerase)
MAMRRKRDLVTGEVTKWKARLNVYVSKQQAGIDYQDTYAPVASWISVRLIMILAVIKGWHTRQLDFVQAFPQAPIDQEIYMDIPKVCIVDNKNNSRWALRLLKNIYGQK